MLGGGEHLSYLPWMDILIQCCRQTVFVTLMETAAASYLMERWSVHISMYLDQFACVIIPTDFCIMLIALFVIGTSDPGFLFGAADNNHEAFEQGLKILGAMTWVNMGFLVVVGCAFCLISYSRLRSTIMNDPVRVYSKVRRRTAAPRSTICQAPLSITMSIGLITHVGAHTAAAAKSHRRTRGLPCAPHAASSTRCPAADAHRPRPPRGRFALRRL